ncbi:MULTISPECIES: phosphotransferase family protein [Leptospira]|uniref:phosphotransferase family protein n=1 Tax=Leptospira TaxID=171 RepID=UPI0002928FE5|nr:MULTISPECIES: phosphotransferase family protein [Leptospira]AVV78486.1 Phosphotransferase enzyme family protein [Leptospira santarosai]EKO77035.1 phosphotransferase enzyme family protein [Leptospira sp. Fiocruz LV3954]EMI62214.1 phosphotransferase enzyme family protein [Leptospira sp. Fiocruz LV4135]MDI7195260.1 phosphotransferase family protein [Leptospira santarosai]ONF85572.1 aminoglycoside phosphotransferase [Leptospira santarosai serovar Grippotyphosa]
MNDTELRNVLEKYLSEKLNGKTEIHSMVSLSGGACQENFAAQVQVSEGPEKGTYDTVFRTDKGAALLASLNREDEFGVCDLAYKAGVNTPKPFWLETDRRITGSPFYFMQKISGKAVGRYVVKDPSLNKMRKQLAVDLAKNLARLHSIKPSDCKNGTLRETLWKGQDPNDRIVANGSIRFLRSELERMEEAHPAMEMILNWLEKRAKPSDDVVLIHGDFRTGNFMVTPEGLQGIVDWEFAHWGDRHEDLTWLCMRDWRFGKLNKEAGGFADRSEFYEEYEKVSGVKPDPKMITYWEVMGNLRWAIGCIGQAERHLSGKDKGIELAAIGRRACEMEYEAMRLIENAG